MNRFHITLAGVESSVDLPDELVPDLQCLYLDLRREQPDDGAPPARYTLEDAPDHWVLSRDGAIRGRFPSPVSALLGMEYDLESTLVSECGGRVAFHAGAAEVNGEAWLIAGNPDVGKTSTTFQLLEMGHAFLCEEVSIVDPRSREVRPFLQTLAVADAVLDEASPAAGQVLELSSGLRRYAPRRLARSTVPAGRLLLPAYDADGPDELVPISAGDALVEVLGYCFEPTQGDEALFDAVISLLQRIPALQLRYSGSAAAGRMLAELAES